MDLSNWSWKFIRWWRFTFVNTIFTSDNRILYDRQLTILKISGIVTVTHPGFISDVKNIYLLTSLLFVHIMNSKSRNQVRLIWHFHNSDIFQNRSDINLEYSHQKRIRIWNINRDAYKMYFKFNYYLILWWLMDMSHAGSSDIRNQLIVHSRDFLTDCLTDILRFSLSWTLNLASEMSLKYHFIRTLEFIRIKYSCQSPFLTW